MLAIGIDEVFAHPIADRDSDRIDAIRLHLSNVVLGRPCAPVSGECLGGGTIGGGLIKVC